MNRSRTNAFSVVEVLIIIVVIAIIAGLGYVFIQSKMKTTNQTSSSSKEVQKISTPSDVNTVSNEMNNLNLDEDTKQVDAAMSEL